jgi:hypothetical protein
MPVSLALDDFIVKLPLMGVAANVLDVSPSRAVNKTVDVTSHRDWEILAVPPDSVTRSAIKLKEFNVL